MREDPINVPRYEFLEPCTSRASIMSKDYLFRAKRASDKVWVFGDLLRYDEKVCIHNGLEGIYYEVDENTIGEHIGFADYNSNLIFEGDIVCFTMIESSNTSSNTLSEQQLMLLVSLVLRMTILACGHI